MNHLPQGDGLWFVCRDGKLLVKPDAAGVLIPEAQDLEALGLPARGPRFLVRLGGRDCWTVEADPDQEPPAGLEFRGLRSLLSELPEELFNLAGRACQIMDWDRHHRFCGRCGAATVEQVEDRAKRCPGCGLLSYARISPAVIVAVTREDRLLLASNRRHAGTMYSVLAGFVDPGESLEECVHREVREEVGIEVTNLRYFGSQPWPFPNSLMVAFTAEHAGGEIVVDKSELIEARWFAAGELPRVPDCGTIARRLIDWFRRGRAR